MTLLFIVEVAVLPLYLLSISIFHKNQQLTENRFGLMIVIYLSVMIYTFFRSISTAIEFRLIGFVLAFLCLFPGYLIAKLIYRRMISTK